MTFIVVTRLRLRDPSFFDDFFAAAVAVVEQAQSSEGNLAADVLGEANNTYWTRTEWGDEAAMRRFMVTEPHRSTMACIDEWSMKRHSSTGTNPTPGYRNGMPPTSG